METLIGVFEFNRIEKEPIPDLVSFDYLEKVQEAAVSKTGKIKINVDGPGYSDNGFKTKPYFKVYMGNNFTSTKPEERARISIKEPEYIIHNNPPGTWKLNSSEKKQLIKILSGAPTKPISSIKDIECKTVWQQIIAIANAEAGIKNTEWEIPMDTPIPDYKDL